MSVVAGLLYESACLGKVWSLLGPITGCQTLTQPAVADRDAM